MKKKRGNVSKTPYSTMKIMNEPDCVLFREKHRALRKRAEECSRLIITAGVLSESFIDAFRSFEEQRQELRKSIDAYRFPLLQDLYFKNRNDERIRKIFSRFETEKEALAYIFNCREDQISETEEEALSGDEIILHIGNLTPRNLTALPGGFSFPEYIEGDLDFRSITTLPERITFPKYIGRNINFAFLTALPEGTVFQKQVKGRLELGGLKYFPEKFTLPEEVEGSVYFINITSFPEGFRFPERIGKFLYLNRRLKGDPSLPAVPRGTEVRWL